VLDGTFLIIGKDLILTTQNIKSYQISGMWRRIDPQKFTDILEDLTASISRIGEEAKRAAILYVLRNVGELLPDYTASGPKEQ
jgi:hypothetical protein